MPSSIVIFVATSNRGKLAEFQEAADEANPPVEVRTIPGFDRMPAAVEDGTTFEANAEKKAVHYSRLAPGLIFADDSGLEVDALGGAPGVLSARFSGRGATDASNIAKLLESMANVPDERRQGRFVCVIALASEGRLIAKFRGETRGIIGRAPRGENGFGYDPLFFFPELGRTFAQLGRGEKLRYSHRGRAFRKLLDWLRTEPQPTEPRP